jgi:DNA processing protein
MAVPGPITSATSAGCHHLLRHADATLVTSTDDVIEAIHEADTRHPGDAALP